MAKQIVGEKLDALRRCINRIEKKDRILPKS